MAIDPVLRCRNAVLRFNQDSILNLQALMNNGDRDSLFSQSVPLKGMVFRISFEELSDILSARIFDVLSMLAFLYLSSNQCPVHVGKREILPRCTPLLVQIKH